MSQKPYIQPISKVDQFPRGLTLTQFIQTVLVGLSNIEGTLVRPQWQPEPPGNPDLSVDWIAFGVNSDSPDANAYVAVAQDGTTTTQRQERLEVALSIYGPNDLGTYELLKDGFQIEQNRYALFNAQMGFVEMSRGLRVPEKVNERWIDRITTSIFFNWQVQRTYPVLTLISATGTIYASPGSDILEVPVVVNA